MNNMVSVIVAICNVDQYLKQCIDSIINQSYTNIDIILIDDGSTDGSSNICDSYGVDERVTVIHKKNGGLVSARKAGLSIAKGDYVIFVDGDDYIDECLCEYMLKEILEVDVDFVHVNYKEADGRKRSWIKKEEIIYLNNQNREEIISSRVFNISRNEVVELITPSIWSKIFKVNFIKKCYNMVPDSQSYGEDLLCLCNAILNGRSMALRKGAFYSYRVRDNSLSHVRGLNNLTNILSLRSCVQSLFKNYSITINQLDDYFWRILYSNLYALNNPAIYIPKFYYEQYKLLYGKKVVLYGAGAVGRDYYIQLTKYNLISLVAWVDKNANSITSEFCAISTPEVLSMINFDCILIATDNVNVYEDIRKYIIGRGTNSEKILWSKPNCYF